MLGKSKEGIKLHIKNLNDCFTCQTQKKFQSKYIVDSLTKYISWSKNIYVQSVHNKGKVKVCKLLICALLFFFIKLKVIENHDQELDTQKKMLQRKNNLLYQSSYFAT